MANHPYGNDSHTFQEENIQSNETNQSSEYHDQTDANIFTRSVYTFGYYSSFCTMLPIFFVANLIPQDSAFSRGCTDGARAARSKEEQLQKHIKSTTQNVGERISSICANASSGIMQHLETIQDRIAERRYHRQATTENHK